MKILLIDIETAPNRSYTWGLFRQNIAINQIDEPGYTLCFAAKWYKGREIFFESIQNSSRRQVAQRAWDLLNEADAVCHYNGRKFDIPTLKKEFLLHEMPPPHSFKEIDLLTTVRRQFRFASNKLDYVSQQLGLGAKTKHMGMDLWRDCMDGCPKAWRLMERYNKQDVRLLEKLYRRILPWIANHPNYGVYLDSDRPTCRKCGSHKVIKKGIERTTTYTYQRYRCGGCGSPLRGRKSLHPPPCGLTV